MGHISIFSRHFNRAFDRLLNALDQRSLRLVFSRRLDIARASLKRRLSQLHNKLRSLVS
jgi:hypothetical protein